MADATQKRHGLVFVTLFCLLSGNIHADEQLVFGSFQNSQNATNWASRVGLLLDIGVVVERMEDADGVWYRVVTAVLTDPAAEKVKRVASANQLRYWNITEANTTVVASVANPQAPVRSVPAVRPAESLSEANVQNTGQGRERIRSVDLDLGIETRTFFESGKDGQSRFHPALSLQMDLYRSWDNEQQSFTFAPFYRFDAEDSERTHFDVRELFWSRVGDDWDLHLGVRQVFWGVTEFTHLVDIVNQTDLVENIDREEKLGQPMAHLSVIRDWGILDIHLLTGFRERTFPGTDGRLRPALEIDTDHATYESAAEELRTDGVIRWSHRLGPMEFGLYQFSGTSRDPEFQLVQMPDGEFVLRPHYPVIDQTGFDAQAIFGDWAWKLEAINRTGFGDRYYAYNAGFERTLVGVMGSRTDLGLVVEYLYDERQEEAFNTLFEHDLAVGTRWNLNDVNDSQALFGVIWDVETDEYIVKLEASRRLGDTWTLLIEGRAFGGADEPDNIFDSLFDPDAKSAAVQDDDFIQLELTRYF